MTDAPLVSVVLPALNEAESVPGLLARYAEFSTDHPGYAFELVVVDDGSTDGTADLVLSQAPASARVTVVRLARTFGTHYAISAGLARSSGDAAVVFDADLQEPPSLLADFLQHWENGSEVVWGVRRGRVGHARPQDLASKAFSSVFARFGNLANYPPEGPSGVLLDRCVIDELGRLPEHNRNVFALIAWLGFTQTRVDYEQAARRNGQPRWTTRTMIKLAIDSLIQFSSMPLRLGSIIGASVAALGLLYALFLVIRAIAGVSTPTGWPTVIVVVLVLGGTQLFVVGIFGEYLWRGVEESRNRPLYVVRDVRVAGQDPAVHDRKHARRRSTSGDASTPRPADAVRANAEQLSSDWSLSE